MSTAAATLRLTFDGLRREQIDLRWVREVGGLEAYVFDGEDLAEESQWRCLRDNLRHVASLGAERLTMHFPTENADWVGDPMAYDKLRRFCDLAAGSAAAGVVLHANQFVSLADWPTFDLSGSRKRVVEKLAELDEYLADAPIWVGVENMPIIGSAGIDFDSIFVLPADFAPLLELNSTRIGVTWDVCHWAVTYSTLASIALLRQSAPPVAPLDLPPLPIRHIHFGSFSGHAMPLWPGNCFEGVAPQNGDLDGDLLARMLARAIDSAPGEVGVVFEVQEDDYRNRVNCWATLDWLASADALTGRYVSRRSSISKSRPELDPARTASVVDLPYARPHWDAAESAALSAALESGFWTNGSQVARFEEELTRIVGAPVVTMSSGTSAIFALLHLLGRSVSAPKLLVTPTLNFAAGPASAKLLGWDVALCDVDAADLNVCAASLGELLDRVHRDYAKIVVLPVHYAGHSCDMTAVSALCARYGADLVEDACHAVGGCYAESSAPVGSWPTSVAAYFSFHPTKPIAAGEGGAVATTAPDLLDELRMLRNHNMSPVRFHEHDDAPWPYSIPVPGMNLRLSEFNAAVGAVQARRAEESRRDRARLAAVYHEALVDLPSVRAVPGQQRPGSAHHLFPVVFDVEALQLSKKDLLAEFHDRRIRCQVHYTPLHRLPAFDDVKPRLRTSFHTMDEAFPGLVSLPLWRGMSDADQERVIGVVSEIGHRSGRRAGAS